MDYDRFEDESDDVGSEEWLNEDSHPNWYDLSEEVDDLEDVDDFDSAERQDAAHDLELLRAYFCDAVVLSPAFGDCADLDSALSPPDSWYYRIHNWTEEDFKMILQEAERDTQTTCVFVDVYNLENWIAVSRTASILSRFRCLTHVEFKCFNGDRHEESLDLHLQYTDHILRTMASSSESQLCSVLLWNVGSRGVFLDFVRRFQASLESLNLGDQDSKRPMPIVDPSLAKNLSSSLQYMDRLRIITFCLAPTTDQSELWSSLFFGMTSARKLQQVSLFLEPSRFRSKRAVLTLIYGLACSIQHCKALKRLRLDCTSMGERVDVTSVIQLAAFSQSLEELELNHVTLFDQGIPQASRETINHSLQGITFTSFTMFGSDTMELLSCYRGLKSIRFVICAEDPSAVDLHRSARPWEALLQHHPTLEMLEYSSGWDKVGAKCIDCDSVLATVALGISKRPLLRELSLDMEGETEFPSLVPLLQGSRGSLKLFLSGHSERNIPFLASGIATANATLQQLCIVMCNLSLDKLAVLLRALKSNRSLKSFYLYAYYVDNNDPGGNTVDPALADLFVDNASLASFALQLIHVSPPAAAGDDDVNLRLLERAADCLRDNRTLRRLRWTYGTRVEAPRALRLLSMLRRNATLLELKGLVYADRRDEWAIDQFLTMNRYGRYLLLPPTASTVPTGLWPKVLARVVAGKQPDTLLQFLRHLPRSVVLWQQRGLRRKAVPEIDKTSTRLAADPTYNLDA